MAKSKVVGLAPVPVIPIEAQSHSRFMFTGKPETAAVSANSPHSISFPMESFKEKQLARHQLQVFRVP